MNIRRIVASAMISTAAAATLAAAPAAAAPAIPSVITDLLNTGSAILRSAPQTPQAPQSPGNLRNGVARMNLTVTNYYGRKYGPDLYATGFAPGVTWSARDRGNGEVKGQNCQVEVSFPGTSFATYRSAACQGDVGFTSFFYRTPGTYTIAVVDRVSGASSSKTFRIS